MTEIENITQIEILESQIDPPYNKTASDVSDSKGAVLNF